MHRGRCNARYVPSRRCAAFPAEKTARNRCGDCGNARLNKYSCFDGSGASAPLSSVAACPTPEGIGGKRFTLVDALLADAACMRRLTDHTRETPESEGALGEDRFRGLQIASLASFSCFAVSFSFFILFLQVCERRVWLREPVSHVLLM